MNERYKHPGMFFLVFGLLLSWVLIILKPLLWVLIFIGWLAKQANRWPDHWYLTVEISTALMQARINEHEATRATQFEQSRGDRPFWADTLD